MAKHQGPYIVDPELQDIMALECSDQSGVMKKVAALMGVPSATAQNWRISMSAFIRNAALQEAEKVISMSKFSTLQKNS